MVTIRAEKYDEIHSNSFMTYQQHQARPLMNESKNKMEFTTTLFREKLTFCAIYIGKYIFAIIQSN